jgi:hypothetical protein
MVLKRYAITGSLAIRKPKGTDQRAISSMPPPAQLFEFFDWRTAANPLPEGGGGLSPFRDWCQGADANFARRFQGNFDTHRE